MELKAGHRYRDRSGEIWEAIKHTDDKAGRLTMVRKYKDHRQKNYLYPNGRWTLASHKDGSPQQCECDLIAHVP